jgi:hypothetical protein
LDSFTACESRPGTHAFQGKEFEGVITYRISYVNCPDNIINGDTLSVFYSKGNLVKLYNGNKPDLPYREVYLLAGNQYYLQIRRSDTISRFDVRQNKNMDLVASSHSLSDTRILGYDCEDIKFQLKYHGNSELHMFNEFLYSTKVLKVNKDYFRDRKYVFFNQYIDESEAFYLKYIFGVQYLGRSGLSTITCTAVKIEELKIDPSVFKVDTTKLKQFSID